MRPALIGLVVASSVLAAVPAKAAEREGFWIAFGGGYGSASRPWVCTGDVCISSSDTSSVGLGITVGLGYDVRIGRRL